MVRFSSALTFVLAVNLFAGDVVGVRNPDALAHYTKALEYGDKGLWSAEILELNRAREVEPRNASILLELGVAHAERQEWNVALNLLHAAIALAPGSARAHYNLALTLDRADPGKGAGIPEYRKVLSLDPRHVDALMNLGVDIGDRNAAEAKPLFQRAIRIAPANAKVHLNFALLLKRQADESGSLSEFREAIRCDPDLLEARRQAISILAAQHQWSQTIEQCREILNREPQDAATRYTFAQALMRSNSEEEGKKELERVVSLRKHAQEQQDAQALQNEGIRHLRAGESQAAVKSFRSALELNGSAANHMYLGLALVGVEDAEAGMRELKTALHLEPGNARAHLNLGSVYLQTGQESSAKSEIERALELDPWLAEAHNNLGMLLAKEEQFKDAEQHFRLAVELEPQYLDAEFNLGLALRNQNRIDDALKAFRRAVELAPENPQAQYALGMTLRDKGDIAAARVALNRAAALNIPR
jgi:superkiller protein 3